MKKQLIQALSHYQTRHDDEKIMVERTIQFLKEEDIFLGKGNLKGHITGSAWIVSPDRKKVLLTHHFKLNIWVQLGGHTEIDETVFESAMREGLEESGLTNLKPLSNCIYDVDVHDIPQRGETPEHQHYDIRYAFEGDDTQLLNVSEESHDLAWVSIEEIHLYSQERSILRMIEKMRGDEI